MKLICFCSFICSYYDRFKLPILLILFSACGDIFAAADGSCNQEDICISLMDEAIKMMSKARSCVGDSQPTDTSNAPDLCQDAAIDTITRTQSGNTYVFKGNFYWEVLSSGTIAEGYPREISCDWDGLEGNLDASVTMSTGKTYFFKGTNYWSFTNKQMDSGYPKLISEGFKGIPNNLDAALACCGNGVYFFKGDKYWRYDSDSEQPVKTPYPLQMSEWSNQLADGVDAALIWENGHTYFFKGAQYYSYNYETSEVYTDPAYPLSTASEWFGCR